MNSDAIIIVIDDRAHAEHERAGIALRTGRRKTAAPLILINGHGDVALAVTVMRAGVFDFLEKPVDDEQLLVSVRRALREGHHVRRRRGKAARPPS